MNIIKEYKNSTNILFEIYDKKEIRRSNLGSFLAMLIIALPLILVLVQLYLSFLMRPYFLLILTSIVFSLLSLLFYLFRCDILLRYKKVETINYKLITLIDFFITFILIIIVTIIAAIFIIPLIVL